VSRHSKLTPGRKQSTCKFCGDSFIHPKNNPGIYCSRKCKSEWQRTQKPVTRDWLIQKYVTDGMDCPAIARIVGRDPKSVWNWLKDLDIPTRPRGSSYASQPQFAFWIHGLPSPMTGRSHTPEFRARMSALCKATGRVPYDPAVGSYMKGRSGAQSTNWKGGITPQRQALYASPEWKAAVKAVWKRDDATCQRCMIRKNKARDTPFDIHHIVGFACKELRSEVSNLVLLCEPCHYWVHSSENVNRDFIKEIVS